LPVTPAMEAGISDHAWSIEEIVALLDIVKVQDAGAPGCAFLPGAFGFLPNSRTANRGTLLPFLISIFWFRVPGAGAGGQGAGGQTRSFPLSESLQSSRPNGIRAL
jgi:hypothetical protein